MQVERSNTSDTLTRRCAHTADDIVRPEVLGRHVPELPWFVAIGKSIELLLFQLGWKMKRCEELGNVQTAVDWVIAGPAFDTLAARAIGDHKQELVPLWGSVTMTPEKGAFRLCEVFGVEFWLQLPGGRGLGSEVPCVPAMLRSQHPPKNERPTHKLEQRRVGIVLGRDGTVRAGNPAWDAESPAAAALPPPPPAEADAKPAAAPKTSAAEKKAAAKAKAAAKEAKAAAKVAAKTAAKPAVDASGNPDAGGGDREALDLGAGDAQASGRPLADPPQEHGRFPVLVAMSLPVLVPEVTFD